MSLVSEVIAQNNTPPTTPLPNFTTLINSKSLAFLLDSSKIKNQVLIQKFWIAYIMSDLGLDLLQTSPCSKNQMSTELLQIPYGPGWEHTVLGFLRVISWTMFNWFPGHQLQGLIHPGISKKFWLTRQASRIVDIPILYCQLSWFRISIICCLCSSVDEREKDCFVSHTDSFLFLFFLMWIESFFRAPLIKDVGFWSWATHNKVQDLMKIYQ